MDAYVGLGSNLGDPDAELRAALEGLTRRGVRLVKCSSVYLTEPVDSDPASWYKNAAAAVRFNGSPLDLLRICLRVEASRGRERPYKNAPRTLDIDLLIAGDESIDTEELMLPHPRLHERRFVLEPMVEIAPELVHPSLGRTMRELLDDCADPSRVERLPDGLGS